MWLCPIKTLFSKTGNWLYLNWLRTPEPEREGSPSCWVGQKVPSVLKVKIKDTFFYFHQELYRTVYSLFCSTTFCHFPGNFIIPFSQNLLFYFLAKNCSKAFYNLPEKENIFSIKRIL